MNTMTNIMEKLKEISGIDISEERLSDEEYTKFKCDTYNQGIGKLNETDGYDCDKCKNKGYIAEVRYQNNDWIETLCECTCQKTRRTILRLMKSGLKNIIKDYTFQKYEATDDWQKHLKSKAIEYVNSPSGSWFFIGGQSGAGKTHLCTAIAGMLLKSGKTVRYMLWRDDINKLKGSVTDSTAYSELIETYKQAEVLYIDDLFKNGKGFDGKVQMPTAADIQIAFEILNYRSNNKQLITIISSERNIADLLDIDEAIGGRIAEMTFERGFGFNIKPDKSKNYRIKGLIDL